jgi:hypothetical protein
MKNKLVISLLILFFVSCTGYQVGSISHPQVQKVAIGKIKNETDEPRLAIFMMEKLKERILQDGSFELVNKGDAGVDAILTGTLTHFDYRARGLRRKNEQSEERYRANFYEMRLFFDYEIMTPAGLVIQQEKKSDYAHFGEAIDTAVERRDGLERASYNLSMKVISHLAEAW